MKKAISIVLFLFLTLSLDAQLFFNTDNRDSSNVYYFSLMQYCKYLKILRVSSDEEVFVEKNYLFTDKLPAELLGFQITYVSIDQLQNLLKLKKSKELTFVRIVPIQIEGANIVINVIPFSAKSEKKKIQLINSGGLGIYFEFDCKNGIIKYKTTKKGYI